MSYERRSVRPDGKVAWLKWTVRMIPDDDGNPFEFQAVGRDITDRKEAEQALWEYSEKIKKFAYSVSHDLKTPTIGINLMTKALHKDLAGVLDEKGERYCDLILKASEELAASSG